MKKALPKPTHLKDRKLLSQSKEISLLLESALAMEEKVYKRSANGKRPIDQAQYTKRKKDSLFATQITKMSDDKFRRLVDVILDEQLVLAIKTFATAPFNAIQYQILLERIEEIQSLDHPSPTT